MKKFLLFLFMVGFSTILLSQNYKVKAGSSIHLRSDANGSSAIISSVPAGAEVNVIDKSHADWWKIKYGGHTGFVSSKLLLEENNTQKTAVSEPAETKTEVKTETKTTDNEPAEKEKKKENTPSDNSGKCFDENSHLLNVGIGFRTGYYPNYSGYNYTYGLTPVISLSYEQAFKKKLGPGYLGVGGFFAFQSEFQRYDYYDNYYVSGGYYYNQYNWNYFMIAARAAYHLDFLMNNKAEVYAGVLLGVRINTYSYSTSYPSTSKYNYYYNAGSVYPAYQVYAGARYYFIKPLAVYAEVGYGIYYGTIGLNLKF